MVTPCKAKEADANLLSFHVQLVEVPVADQYTTVVIEREDKIHYSTTTDLPQAVDTDPTTPPTPPPRSMCSVRQQVKVYQS